MSRRPVVITVLAGVVFLAALLDPELGMLALILLGLLLAFSAGSSGAKARASGTLTRRNLGLAGVMMTLGAWYWLGYPQRPTSTLVAVAAALMR